MKTKPLFFITLTFSMLVLTTSCKKEKIDPPVETPPQVELQLLNTDPDVILPESLQNSTNEHAQACETMVSSALSTISSFSTMFAVPEGAQRVISKGTETPGIYVYTWAWGGYTVIWKLTETADKYLWEIKLGINNAEPVTYCTAWQLIDGSQGEVQYNWNYICQQAGEECSDYYWVYSWNISTNGTINIDVNFQGEGYSAESYLYGYKLVVNPDGSGDLEYYLNGTVWAYYLWYADGSGSITTYLPSTSTFSWSAN